VTPLYIKQDGFRLRFHGHRAPQRAGARLASPMPRDEKKIHKNKTKKLSLDE
jgi:hypothetical protein